MFRKAVLTWVLFVPLAIMNGVIRQAVYRPVVGDLPAHQISTAVASAAFVAVTYATLHTEAACPHDHTLLRVGAGWVAATVLFEFGFGHYVAGNSWKKLLHDYKIAEGRIWPLSLATLLMSPLLVKRLSTHKRSRPQRLGV